MKKILILGASGMLGSTMARYFFEKTDVDVTGTVRSISSLRFFSESLTDRMITGVDVENSDHLLQVFSKVKPDFVINCVGLVKQLESSNDPLSAVPINSLFPHRLAHLSAAVDARLIHISTDCVFSGKEGMYNEDSVPDALDMYGRSKLIGEVDYDNAITLRTSLIGHELCGARSLINWFLSQEGAVKGYKNAIFSGLPTVELARVIYKYVLPAPELRGLYHLSADPISKYELLSLVAEIYEKKIEVIPDESLVIDRSLDSARFRHDTGYLPKDWPELILMMREFR